MNEIHFKEVVFADDLNAYREFSSKTPNQTMQESSKLCPKNLHDWGAANQVVLHPGKESFHILAKVNGIGNDFKSLGFPSMFY